MKCLDSYPRSQSKRDEDVKTEKIPRGPCNRVRQTKTGLTSFEISPFMAEVEITRTGADAIQTDYTSHHLSMQMWRQTESARQSESALGSDRGSVSDAFQSRREPRDFVLTVGKPAEAEHIKHYKGRLRTWPGLFLLLVLVGGAIVGLVIGSHESHKAADLRISTAQKRERAQRAIDSGLTDSSSVSIDVAEDGQVGNPKTYPTQKCAQLNYQSKNGRIVAVLPNNTEVAVDIKGLNWFGMETGLAIPFGLWANPQNGTTVYEIATFMAANKFNMVRLPVCVTHILKNTAPSKNLVNLQVNRAMDLTNYMTALQSIISALAYRNIGVLISLHTLTPVASGGNWYDESLGVSKTDFLKAVDILTKNLCKSDFWNIVGLDLKNEPYQATWADFSDGAGVIGSKMLSGCKNWLAFVEGTNIEKHSAMIGGVMTAYGDWWGGGLQGVATKPVVLPVDNKIVYAPHYYNSGVYPQPYFYGPGQTELSDADLQARVFDSATAMFGYIAQNKKEALVLGEFAGLYATDHHPLLTTRRTTDYLIQLMLRDGYAGGFMWSLNPESAYQYNPTGPGTWTEGLLMDDWLTSNSVFVKGMAAMDALPNLKMLPCVLTTASSS
ncbi:Aste57867_21920 [Aphanomyces stellatus]|uniref:Aste57867_21920 protein n=1 Tax=Aphanomyces stellatus TaxID=120398 RepID=A0A485LKV3_9STRA|nr:hypothetical protein As57867_021851 [Aphanomyces stellatus]VFT98588.1 Aste57867_21920 [Aphanomyces stellatus]